MAEQTLGGQRLGAGKEMTVELYNYGMNSFNQGRDWKSTMGAGILYPCFKEIGTNHGTFDIDIDTLVRTLPTKGPLFGSFKLQIDLFNVPFRLYQGILHNNPVDIGMNMHRVKLPKLIYQTIDGTGAPKVAGTNEDDCQVSTSALIKYMGISGAGHVASYSQEGSALLKRKFQCVPELGYYDIFKNYYSNKQEENAYVIIPGKPKEIDAIWRIIQGNATPDESQIREDIVNYTDEILIIEKEDRLTQIFTIYVRKTNKINEVDAKQGINLHFNSNDVNLDDLNNAGMSIISETEDEEYFVFTIRIINWNTFIQYAEDDSETTATQEKIQFQTLLQTDLYTADIKLEQFALKNIDKMRSLLLANNELDDEVTIENVPSDSNTWGTDSGTDQTGLPYIALAQQTNEGISWNAFTENGLVVKTYQSDLFNNWLDSTIVNEISTRTKIDTTSGGFTPDTLILQEKIYKLLNRILVAGGTYYDWQEATYGEGVARMCEIPMYIGGMSTEIMFEEVIANNESKIDGKYQALGTLAGKGQNVGRKGGNNIHVRMDEPGYIIGIVSITPRISFFQGNEWDRTELDTMDDLHKPELDGIGFQDLMVEQMAWWNTVMTPSSTSIIHRDALGKQTAWINYQTAVDKVYGDFAKADGYSFMVLSRQYEHGEDSIFTVKDLTTYIDPSKYNYAFAYNDLAAQNFWVEIKFNVTSRRKMGAQQLPNL